MRKNKKNPFFKFGHTIISILVILDLMSKLIFNDKNYFSDGLIFIESSKNFGSAMSMFSTFAYYNLFVIIISIFVLSFIIKNKNKYFGADKLLKIAYLLSVSGIIGNLYDRIFFGYVRDFIGFKYLFIFNLADVYLTFAVVLFFLGDMKLSKIKSKYS